jgi:RNase H-like domain found in reverse transcriptase
MQQQLKKLIVVAQPDAEKVLCVFSDASDKYIFGGYNPNTQGDLDLPVAEQHHQPLALSSGALKGAELRWVTPEKEGYALVQTVLTLDYLLLWNESFRILTDHRNLYIYNPLSVDQTLARHTVHKLQ